MIFALYLVRTVTSLNPAELDNLQPHPAITKEQHFIMTIPTPPGHPPKGFQTLGRLGPGSDFNEIWASRVGLYS